MNKIIPLLIVTLSLYASNPKPYSVLGDVIYENATKIEKLKLIDLCLTTKKNIDKYLVDVSKTKTYGFELEANKNNRDKKIYLEKLRNLSKINDEYLRNVKSNYSRSMKSNNFELFTKLINSGLLDTENNKVEIIDYYYKHSDDINSSGVIDDLLDDDAKLKAQKEALKRRYKTKKQLELENIKRIRENDRLAKEKLESELQDNLDKKKLKIREDQKKELNN